MLDFSLAFHHFSLEVLHLLRHGAALAVGTQEFVGVVFHLGVGFVEGGFGFSQLFFHTFLVGVETCQLLLHGAVVYLLHKSGELAVDGIGNVFALGILVDVGPHRLGKHLIDEPRYLLDSGIRNMERCGIGGYRCRWR